MKHTFELGKKHGVVKGVRKYLDEQGMTGAVAIIIALGAVLIGLYIIAIVVGAMGTQVTGGNILLSGRWNTTISNIDASAGSTFNDGNGGLNSQYTDGGNIASILPIAIVGVGICDSVSETKPFAAEYDHRGRCVCRKVNSLPTIASGVPASVC